MKGHIIGFKCGFILRNQCPGSLTITYQTEKKLFSWLLIKSFRICTVKTINTQTTGRCTPKNTKKYPLSIFFGK